jgi:hypothetical protein
VVVTLVTPYSKNKRIVTIATPMWRVFAGRLGCEIEVVALMIGDITQCYSSEGYDNPTAGDAWIIPATGSPEKFVSPW